MKDSDVEIIEVLQAASSSTTMSGGDGLVVLISCDNLPPNE